MKWISVGGHALHGPNFVIQIAIKQFLKTKSLLPQPVKTFLVRVYFPSSSTLTSNDGTTQSNKHLESWVIIHGCICPPLGKHFKMMHLQKKLGKLTTGTFSVWDQALSFHGTKGDNKIKIVMDSDSWLLHLAPLPVLSLVLVLLEAQLAFGLYCFCPAIWGLSARTPARSNQHKNRDDKNELQKKCFQHFFQDFDYKKMMLRGKDQTSIRHQDSFEWLCWVCWEWSSPYNLDEW